jgi:uncharacterized RDD family membrane protein YckC
MAEEQFVSNDGESAIVYGGFLKRGAALIIDLLLFVIPSVLVNIAAFEVVKALVANGQEWTLQSYFKAQIPPHILVIVSMSSQLIWCSVVAWFLSKYKWQATPGKRLMKVYVISVNGSRLSYKNALVRTFLPVALVILLNIVNLIVINKNIESADKSYEQTLKEFVPSLEQEVTKSGKPLKDFMETSEGKAFFSQEVSKFTPERKDEFMTKVQSAQIQNQQHGILMNILPFLFMSLLLGWYLVALFTKEKTTLHDIIAKTRVVKGQL